MWLYDLTTEGSIFLEILISLPPQPLISRIKIWNFNKSNVKENTKGVRECEVFVSGVNVWKGVVERGCGNQYQGFDFFTAVNLSKNGGNSATNTDNGSDSSDNKLISDRTLDLIGQAQPTEVFVFRDHYNALIFTRSSPVYHKS